MKIRLSIIFSKIPSWLILVEQKLLEVKFRICSCIIKIFMISPEKVAWIPIWPIDSSLRRSRILGQCELSVIRVVEGRVVACVDQFGEPSRHLESNFDQSFTRQTASCRSLRVNWVLLAFQLVELVFGSVHNEILSLRASSRYFLDPTSFDLNKNKFNTFRQDYIKFIANREVVSRSGTGQENALVFVENQSALRVSGPNKVSGSWSQEQWLGFAQTARNYQRASGSRLHRKRRGISQ